MYNSRFGVTISDLAEELAVTQKTVRRTLNTLEVSFPVVQEKRDGRKHFKLMAGFQQEFEVPFMPAELMSLYFFKDFMAPLEGTGFEDQFRMLIKKIENGIPDSARKFCDHLENSFRTRVTHLPRYQDNRLVMKLLNKSVCERKAIKITYYSYSSKRMSKRKIHPYCMYFYDGTIYIVAKDFLSKETRIFNMTRVRKAELINENFKLPKDFDAQTYFKDAFGIFHEGESHKVVIEFSKSVAPFIEEKVWHESQEIKSMGNGKIRLSMTLSSLKEVKAWVLGFAHHAKIIEPQQLVDDVKENLERMMKAYS